MAMMISFICSRWVLSLGIAVLFGQAVISLNILPNFKNLLKEPKFLAFTAIFFLFFIGGFWTADQATFWKGIRSKLPFLMLPVAFLAIPDMHRRIYQLLIYLFVIVLFGSAVWVLFEFYSNYATYIKDWDQPKYIPTPIHHIHYSLMIAISIPFCIYFSNRTFFEAYAKIEQWILRGLALFFFLFIHFVSARSGILAIYLVIIVYGILMIVRQKAFVLGAVLLLFALGGPVIAYYTVPSFYNKINYMKWDIDQLRQGKSISQYSDARRLVSFDLAWKAIKKQPMFGYGTGDDRVTMDMMYDKHRPETLKADRLRPTNQLLHIVLILGFAGLFIFLLLLWLSFIGWTGNLSTTLNSFFDKALLWPFVIIMLSSFIAEITLEWQLGAAIFTIFGVLLLDYYRLDEI